MSSEYLIDIPGLADMVAAVPVDPADTKHQALLRALRAVPALETVEYATSRDGFSLVQHKVFDAGGALVHDDHRAWLAQEYVNDGARAGVTHQRLRAAGLRLAETEITKLYLVVDRGGAEENFLQLEVEVLVDR
ncbi:MAG: hypothetical protein IIZ69_03005, partial [Pseudomonas sp.]|nr:hypothetical protein [Pseudomonas sp.]